MGAANPSDRWGWVGWLFVAPVRPTSPRCDPRTRPQRVLGGGCMRLPTKDAHYHGNDGGPQRWLEAMAPEAHQSCPDTFFNLDPQLSHVQGSHLRKF